MSSWSNLELLSFGIVFSKRDARIRDHRIQLWCTHQTILTVLLKIPFARAFGERSFSFPRSGERNFLLRALRRETDAERQRVRFARLSSPQADAERRNERKNGLFRMFHISLPESRVIRLDNVSRDLLSQPISDRSIYLSMAAETIFFSTRVHGII